MPHGAKVEWVEKTRLQFHDNIDNYPYHCYINWPSVEIGNVLYHDARFVKLLYQVNGDAFYDNAKVNDVSRHVKDTLIQFIAAHERIELVVDCENSDPYKLCSVLRYIQNFCGDQIHKIRKIILYDDNHTVHAWRILEKYVDIPVEHEMVDRVKADKSLVDIRMTAGTCREHYTEQIDGFLLVASDSDYWGLISSLPTADFLVLVEYDKYGTGLREALEKAGVAYCFIDNFAGSISDIKTDVLCDEIQSYFSESIRIDTNALIRMVLERSRISMTEAERQAFYERYICSLRISIDGSGIATISVVK